MYLKIGYCPDNIGRDTSGGNVNLYMVRLMTSDGAGRVSLSSRVTDVLLLQMRRKIMKLSNGIELPTIRTMNLVR